MTNTTTNFESIELETSDQLNRYYSIRGDILNLHEISSPWERASRTKTWLIKESTEFDEISPVLNRLQVMSAKSVKEGDTFAVIDLDVIPYHKEVIMNVSKLKVIEKIKLTNSGSIDYVEFTDGTRYPKQIHATYNNKPLFLAYYFKSVSELEKAKSILKLSFPESWELITETLMESSGYIPSESEKNDPRWKTALTVDVTPTSIQDNARKLGSIIGRDGVPPNIRNNDTTAKYNKRTQMTTTSGSIATGGNSNKKTSSIFTGIKTSKKYANSLTEGKDEFQIINKKTKEVHGTYRFEPAAQKALNDLDDKHEFKIVKKIQKEK